MSVHSLSGSLPTARFDQECTPLMAFYAALRGLAFDHDALVECHGSPGTAKLETYVQTPNVKLG